jgi:hypothetical protein
MDGATTLSTMTISRRTLSITESNMTHSILTHSIMVECYFAMSFILGVTNKPAMLSVIILNIVLESVVMLNVLAPYTLWT